MQHTASAHQVRQGASSQIHLFTILDILSFLKVAPVHIELLERSAGTIRMAMYATLCVIVAAMKVRDARDSLNGPPLISSRIIHRSH